MIHEDTLAQHRLDDDGAPVPTPAPLSYKLGCIVKGEPGRVHYNAVRLATVAECEEYGRDLYSRWMGLARYEVQPSDEPVNYRMVDGHLFSLASLEDHSNG